MQNLLSPDTSLCFKENEFSDRNFNVDKFVAKCKDRVPMSKLREDLEAHYKNIQHALVELINRDYADFVSLSSNLIGTDKTIGNLCGPLDQFKEQVLAIQKDLKGALDVVEKKLEQRRKVREKKSCLHHLITVVHSVEKIEKTLTADLKSPDMEIFMHEDKTHPGHVLERVAGEFNQLQFHVNQSKGHPIIESIKPRVALITSKLQENLETTFEQGISSKDSELISRCLRTYALIDKTSHAEEMFKHLVVKPFVDEVISETYLDQHGLEQICADLLKFVEDECQIMIELTSAEMLKNDVTVATATQDADGNKGHTVKGFDFLVNSVWVEIAQAFEENLPLIFSPGNPDSFLARYKTMMRFMDNFEEQCMTPECFKALRSHPGYHSFMVKWSLPVYFQIRFQDIGGEIEMSVDRPNEKSPEDLFMTNIVGTCWNSIKRCWCDEVYIAPLKGRFWKLTLQISNRLCIFLKNISEKKDEKERITIENMTSLLGDSSYFSKKFGDYFKESIVSKLNDSASPVNLKGCKDSVDECIASLHIACDGLCLYMVNRLSDEGIVQLENVNNVPRLFRRTNKEPPTTPSSYVQLAFQSLESFKSTSSTLDVKYQKKITEDTAHTMLSKFYNSVNELLTSIKKTEDSLLRLKQQRMAAAGQSSPILANKASEASDEDKIRKQLLLDAQEFGVQMEKLGLSLENEEYKKLKDVTEKSLQK
eukprot:TCONS_00009640-protein